MFDTSTLRKNWRDPETKELANLLDILLSQTSFEIREPINLANFGSGPAIAVKQMTDGITAIEQTNRAGQVASVGFGMASRGLVANELIPDPNFAIDPEIVRQQLSTQGNNPASREETDGFNTGVSGSGVPHTLTPMVPTGDWGRALTSLQKSNDTEHAPGAMVKLTRDGQVYWWACEPWKLGSIRGQITAVNDDTLTVETTMEGRVPLSEVTIAKPYTLRRTPFDGETIDGVTYTYSDSQHRSVDDGGAYAPEDQIVDPPYSASIEQFSWVFFNWIVNGSGLDEIWWMDENRDSRHWEPV